mmetsp:Transcript_73510/g.177380  ORF Transcript_73510/g.177380 Transcript_73510/m.177380 type:complete len:237 (+) Transcript_73510:114-824(+)
MHTRLPGPKRWMDQWSLSRSRTRLLSSSTLTAISSATICILSAGSSRKASMRSPSTKLCASTVLRSFWKERHSEWSRPPTPLMTPGLPGEPRSLSCSLLKKLNSSCGSEATTPSTPLTVPKSSVGICATPLSGTCIESDPFRKRLTNSPRWNSPTTSSRCRSSSVVASAFLRVVKRLYQFSAPRKVSSSRKETAVIQLALKSRESSLSSPEAAVHCSSDTLFMRSPTRMKSPRLCT